MTTSQGSHSTGSQADSNRTHKPATPGRGTSGETVCQSKPPKLAMQFGGSKQTMSNHVQIKSMQITLNRFRNTDDIRCNSFIFSITILGIVEYPLITSTSDMIRHRSNMIKPWWEKRPSFFSHSFEAPNVHLSFGWRSPTGCLFRGRSAAEV